MEIICNELNIPKKQIKETSTPNRFLLLVHKSWIQCLIKQKKLIDFPAYLNLYDWPSICKSQIESVWTTVFISVHKKHNHKVIPITRCGTEQQIYATSHEQNQQDDEIPQTYNQLLQNISQTNYRNLWKNAYNKYSGSHQLFSISASTSHPNASTINQADKLLQHSIPYNCALKEIITKLYNCPIVHIESDKIHQSDDSESSQLNETHYNFTEQDMNLYPVISTIETNTHFILVYNATTIENTLLDCVTYSPAIIEKSHNKILFLIYQLLQLARTLNNCGLILGNISLSDIYLTENLWLHIIPNIEANILSLKKFSIENQQLFNKIGINNEKNDVQKECNKINMEKYTLQEYCKMWCHGQLTNFDYLTILNNLSGRKLNCPTFHHIMPWVTDFQSRNGINWRDLTKSKYRLNKGDIQLDLMFTPTLNSTTNNDNNLPPHHVTDVLSEITYYVYMSRRTSKQVLCKYVRPVWVPLEYPASIQRLQEWTPDECIPEFYTDPLIFKSIHEDLPDLEVPIWSSCPEDFIIKHREALESQYVSERLHHWIDLNFGYKLTGLAAVKAKNVCLQLIDNHKELHDNGIVQLFQYPHPPKLQMSPWISKIPPRVYSKNESIQRLTRSSDDLTNLNIVIPSSSASNSSTSSSLSTFHLKDQQHAKHSNSPSRKYSQSKNFCDDESSDNGSNIERSISYHSNVQQKITSNLIILPKNYNPISNLTAIENMEIFLGKTFNSSSTSYAEDEPIINESDVTFKTSKNHQLSLNSNRMYEDLINEYRLREYQIIGCIIVEIFLVKKLRPFGNWYTQKSDTDTDYMTKKFNERLQACLNVLKYDSNQIPKCLQYPIKLLLEINRCNDNEFIDDKGLPTPRSFVLQQLLLQPLLSNSIFPFPANYIKIYNLLRSLKQFQAIQQLLHIETFIECDGKNCKQYERIDRLRLLYKHKIINYTLKSFVVQINGMLEPIGFEQFQPIEIMLPFIIDLLTATDEKTAVMTAFYLFDNVAYALGRTLTQQHLLEPILRLYDMSNNEHDLQICSVNQYDATTTTTTSSSLSFTSSSSTIPLPQISSISTSSMRYRKSIQLYHHNFLIKLIVRFGLKIFLNNFIVHLIEAIGSFNKDEQLSIENNQHHRHHHCQQNSIHQYPNKFMINSLSNKNFNFSNCGDDDNNRNNNSSCIIESTTLSFQTNNDKNDSQKPLLSPSTNSNTDEMFTFENDGEDVQKLSYPDELSDNDTESAILKIIDQLNINTEGSLSDLYINNSTGISTEEALEADEIHMDDNQTKKAYNELNKLDKIGGPKSPIIPIPTSQPPLAPTKQTIKPSTASSFRRSTELNGIECEIGSRKSIDSNEFLDKSSEDASLLQNFESMLSTKESFEKIHDTHDKKQQCSSTHLSLSSSLVSPSVTQNKISEMSTESIKWLTNRIGPVLTAKYLSRNLLKMLTLCYVGQENLLPDFNYDKNENLHEFTIAYGRVMGDKNSIKVLECLTSISALYGDQFILLQYFPHICELIVLCKKRITTSLEGGLISSLQLLKILVPCLNDSTIMDQLHDTILKSIIHPIIRLLGSTKYLMPNGFLARNILARKLLDVIYVLAIRIGPEMTKEHICVPALQRFFLIFDKAYRIYDHYKNEETKNEQSPSNSSDDSNFTEMKRNGSPIQISQVKYNNNSSFECITPPVVANNSIISTTPSPLSTSTMKKTSNVANVLNLKSIREKALDELTDVFTPNLAHDAYVPFLKYLGENIMSQNVKNLSLILNLCHECNQSATVPPTTTAIPSTIPSPFNTANVSYHLNEDDKSLPYSNSFGSTRIIGNRLEIQNSSISGASSIAKSSTTSTNNFKSINKKNNIENKQQHKIIDPNELIDFVAYKYDVVSSNVRHLRGNWLAYWEHEIGRSEKDAHFNLKQIKLQTFSGHTNSIRSILCLDNENSFMSASKDKTVKLWALRSEGDGSKITSCQFTYTNHRKSVHSLTFLDSLRLTISCDSGVHIWDPFTGTTIGQLDSHKFIPVSVVKTYPSPSALVLAGAGITEATLKIIDSRTINYVNEWKVTTSGTACGSVRCIAVSPSGNWIAVGLSSGQLILMDGRTGIIIANWKATDGELLQLIPANEQQIISSSLDQNICVWSTIDGTLLYNLKSLAEPAHCLLSNGMELIFGTPSNRIGVYPTINPDVLYSMTKLRSETFRGVLTSLAILPLNHMLLVGGDSGNISLLC